MGGSRNEFLLLHLTISDRLFAIETLCGGGRCVHVQDCLLAQSHQIGQTTEFVIKHCFSVPPVLGRLKASIGKETTMWKARIARGDAGGS